MSQYSFTPTSFSRTHNVTHTRGHASRRVQGSYQCTLSTEDSAHGIPPLSLSLPSGLWRRLSTWYSHSLCLLFSTCYLSLSLSLSLSFLLWRRLNKWYTLSPSFLSLSPIFSLSRTHTCTYHFHMHVTVLSTFSLSFLFSLSHEHTHAHITSTWMSQYSLLSLSLSLSLLFSLSHVHTHAHIASTWMSQYSLLRTNTHTHTHLGFFYTFLANKSNRSGQGTK